VTRLAVSVGQGKKVQVEFVSATYRASSHRPRQGAAIGDTICRLLAATGWDVTRSSINNDGRAQIATWRLVQGRLSRAGAYDPRWPADGYQGE